MWNSAGEIAQFAFNLIQCIPVATHATSRFACRDHHTYPTDSFLYLPINGLLILTGLDVVLEVETSTST